MRKVFYSINISLDGYCDHTIFNPDEELMEYFAGLMQSADELVYGRKTYDLMFPYWADVAEAQSDTKATNAFAKALTNTNKIVFSKTLTSVEGNARIVHENLAEEVIKLKQLPGKKIAIGGVSVRSQLLAHDLIDEYYILVHPIIVGKGTLLFDDIDLQRINLKLVDTKVFKSGCVAMHYERG